MIRINILLIFIISLVSCGENSQSGESSANAQETVKKSDSVTKSRNIVFFGNSITAGYGLQLSEAFPALLQKKIDSMNLPYKTVNAGVSGETSADGAARIDWILKQPVEVFVLELGGNDGLRGLPLSETKKNLQLIIDKVKTKYPSAEIILAGMQIPPNMGRQYATDFKNLFPELAAKNNAALIPFLLEGVGGEAKLNLDDGIHPTAEGHQKLADNVWKVLAPLL